MKLSDKQVTVDALRQLVSDAIRLLCSGDYTVFAERYGYVWAFGEPEDMAIEDDLRRCLIAVHATDFSDTTSLPVPSVGFFKKNNISIFATIDAQIPTTNGREIWADFVVFEKDNERNLCLEQLHAPDDGAN